MINTSTPGGSVFLFLSVSPSPCLCPESAVACCLPFSLLWWRHHSQIVIALSIIYTTDVIAGFALPSPCPCGHQHRCVLLSPVPKSSLYSSCLAFINAIMVVSPSVSPILVPCITLTATTTTTVITLASLMLQCISLSSPIIMPIALLKHTLFVCRY